MLTLRSLPRSRTRIGRALPLSRGCELSIDVGSSFGTRPRRSVGGTALPVAAFHPDMAVSRQPTPVVLLHGMWHGAWYYAALQRLLAKHGFSSYAIDLLPGARTRGGLRAELVNDVRATLDALRLRDAVMVGHSQGGLVSQSFMQDALPARPDTLAGAVMLGSFPLGLFPPTGMLLRRKSIYTELGVFGYSHLSVRGLLRSTDEHRRIFVLHSTTDTNVCQGGLPEYLTRLAAAPPDGLLTMTHFVPPHTPAFSAMAGKPVLVLGAGSDIIYPPDVLAPHFSRRFPGAEHVVAAGQAHCFVDPGWEQTMGAPLIAWLQRVAGSVKSRAGGPSTTAAL